MAKITAPADTVRYRKKPPTKTERNKPGRVRRKRYRGQGKV